MASQTVSRAVAARVRTITTADRQAVYLVTLLLAVSAGAIWLAALLTAQPDAPTNEVSNPGAGAGLAVAEALWAALLLSLIWLYKRLSRRYQTLIRYNGLLALAVWLGTVARDLLITGGVAAGQARGLAMLALCALFTAHYLLDAWRVFWILNNGYVLVIATVGGAMLGILMSVWTLLAFLVGLTIYDWYFADNNEYMFELAQPILRARLPALFVKPPTWRLDWGAWLDELAEEGVDDGDTDEPDNGEWALGMADLLIAAAVVVAVYTSPTLAHPDWLAGAVLAGLVVAGLRIRHKMLTTGAGAGLPAITGGTVTALALGLVGSYAALLVGGGV